MYARPCLRNQRFTSCLHDGPVKIGTISIRKCSREARTAEKQFPSTPASGLCRTVCFVLITSHPLDTRHAACRRAGGRRIFFRLGKTATWPSVRLANSMALHRPTSIGLTALRRGIRLGRRCWLDLWRLPVRAQWLPSAACHTRRFLNISYCRCPLASIDAVCALAPETVTPIVSAICLVVARPPRYAIASR